MRALIVHAIAAPDATSDRQRVGYGRRRPPVISLNAIRKLIAELPEGALRNRWYLPENDDYRLSHRLFGTRRLLQATRQPATSWCRLCFFLAVGSSGWQLLSLQPPSISALVLLEQENITDPLTASSTGAT